MGAKTKNTCWDGLLRGGRTCRTTIDRMIESANPGTSPHEIPLKYQPPIRAVTFGAVGEKQ